MDITEIRARKKRASRTVQVILDPDLRQAVIDAEVATAEAQRRADLHPANQPAAADLAEATRRLDAARRAAREETVVFRFEALGREAFEALRDSHPPSSEQRSEFRRSALAMGLAPHQIGELAHNPDTFPPALLAACCADPAMTETQARDLWDSDEFSQAELAEMFDAALTVNQSNRRVELGEG